MRKCHSLLFVYLFSGYFSILFAQNVIEVQKPKISEIYLEVMEKTAKVLGQNPEEAIRLLKESLVQIVGDYERFNITFRMFFIYSGMGKLQEALNILMEEQKEGFFYPVLTDEGKFLPYIEKLESYECFNKFIEENNRLKENEQKDAKFEYIVQLPGNYIEEKAYPLLMVLTGGWGSHIGLSENWYSVKLQSDYIVAYLQGVSCRGSYLRSYNRENMDNILEAYKQIINNYAIDTSQVILGGQSAGGRRAITLTLDELLPVDGLILAFPVVPSDLDIVKIKKAAEHNIRIAILTGENDFGLKKQKEAAVLFDKQGLANRFIIYPEKGHEFPDDFTKQIDLSLDFILKE
jgi:predicted esterase